MDLATLQPAVEEALGRATWLRHAEARGWPDGMYTRPDGTTVVEEWWAILDVLGAALALMPAATRKMVGRMWSEELNAPVVLPYNEQLTL